MPFTFAKDQYLKEFMQKYVQPQPSYRGVNRNIAPSNCMKLFHTMNQNLTVEFNNFNGIISFVLLLVRM